MKPCTVLRPGTQRRFWNFSVVKNSSQGFLFGESTGDVCAVDLGNLGVLSENLFQKTALAFPLSLSFFLSLKRSRTHSQNWTSIITSAISHMNHVHCIHRAGPQRRRDGTRRSGEERRGPGLVSCEHHHHRIIPQYDWMCVGAFEEHIHRARPSQRK